MVIASNSSCNSFNTSCNSSNSFCNSYDDVTGAATSFFNIYANPLLISVSSNRYADGFQVTQLVVELARLEVPQEVDRVSQLFVVVVRYCCSGFPGYSAGRGVGPAGGVPRSFSSSGSRAEFCGFCGGKHSSTQCVGVQGSCNICSQYGHFVRVCPSAGSQQDAAPPQGRGGSSRGRSPQFLQPRVGET
ncbi:hypothetical protein F511_20653 [Dorcoceras hygrometricum]|uniref:CCHC-type domain-containing protein n=1 Tax=Dorcoceras hygrometricum TaxID=472368 RepID=A0A2Z7D2B5_9LAMI|nr:hypothetical protein F511_20653 [Dorcoceras hygrometricum]